MFKGWGDLEVDAFSLFGFFLEMMKPELDLGMVSLRFLGSLNAYFSVFVFIS